MNKNKMTLAGCCCPPVAPGQIQRNHFVSNKHYNTSVKIPVKTASEQDAETKALGLLRESSFH